MGSEARKWGVAAKLADRTIDIPAVRSRPPRRPTRRPERPQRGSTPSRGIHPAVAPAKVPGWEWGLVVVTLFVLGRSPVLFYRERVAELLGADRALPVWSDDGVLRATFAAALLATYVVAARRCEPRTLLRQPFLLAFLAVGLASVSWSVEPGVSMWRIALFAGTAVLGWYIGERYSIRQIVSIVGAVAAVGALTSIVAVFVWPTRSQATNQIQGIWSGVYVNRNLLGHAMAIGLVALPFIWATVPKRRRMLLVAVGGLELFLLIRSGSRTPLVAMSAAAAVALPLLVVRRATTRALKPSVAAFAVGLVTGYLALVAHWNWQTIVVWLDRGVRLSRRTIMWGADRYYVRMQPFKGWGFEAIWAHPPTIAVAQTAYGKFPYSSHSGYFEVLLSTGWIGFGLFAAFLAMSAWRAFRFAWEGRDAASLWPLSFIVFAAVANISESLWVSSEATWALTVAAAVAATGARRRRPAVS